MGHEGEIEKGRTVKVRFSARLVVLNQENRVLMFRYEDAEPSDPANPAVKIYWARRARP